MKPGNQMQSEKKIVDSGTNSIRLSISLTVLFLFLLFLLHILRPDIDPSWHFISEYALGRHGWMMSAAFILLGGSYIFLFLSVRPILAKHAWSFTGLGLLLVSATGLLLAGFYKMDPAGVSNTEATLSGSLHNLGGTLGMAMPAAAIIISRGLLKCRAEAVMRRELFLAGLLAVIGFLQAIILMGIQLSQSNGQTGPGVNIGWPNRIEIILNCAWLLMAGIYVLRNNLATAKSDLNKPITSTGL